MPAEPTAAPALPTVPLTGGVALPRIGLGVFDLDEEATATMVCTALQHGARSVDTAAAYGNERGVGEGIRRSGVPRDEIVVTTKLWNTSHGVAEAREALEASLDRLGLGHVDVYLVHWPHSAAGRWTQAWEGLQACQEAGLARTIGVSNFSVEHLDALAAAGGPQPALNQVELHPYLVQRGLREAHAARGVRTQSWSPLARGQVLTDPRVLEIADGYGVGPARLVLAWQLAVADATVVKTSSADRLVDNLRAAELRLDPEHVAALSALDRGHHVEDWYYRFS